MLLERTFGLGTGIGTLTPAQVRALIISSANAHGISPAIPLAVAAHESGFNPDAINCANTNGTCDAGVMQINQTNWNALGLSDPFGDPQANVDAGVQLIAQYLAKYNGNEGQVLCAYQYGPGRCADPNNLPSLTPGFVRYVDNWITQNYDPNYGSSAGGGGGGGGVLDALAGYGINLAQPDTTTIVLLAAGALVLAKVLRLI